MNPSILSDSDSSLQATTVLDTFPTNELEKYPTRNYFSLIGSEESLSTPTPQNDLDVLLDGHNQDNCQIYETTIHTDFLVHDNDELCIIAEPKAFYRERYSSEIDPGKKRAQRFIRTEDDNKNYEYPTVKVMFVQSTATKVNLSKRTFLIRYRTDGVITGDRCMFVLH
jgi:hypothetical protein